MLAITYMDWFTGKSWLATPSNFRSVTGKLPAQTAYGDKSPTTVIFLQIPHHGCGVVVSNGLNGHQAPAYPHPSQT